MKRLQTTCLHEYHRHMDLMLPIPEELCRTCKGYGSCLLPRFYRTGALTEDFQYLASLTPFQIVWMVFVEFGMRTLSYLRMAVAWARTGGMSVLLVSLSVMLAVPVASYRLLRSWIVSHWQSVRAH